MRGQTLCQSHQQNQMSGHEGALTDVGIRSPTPTSQSFERGFIAVAEAAENPKQYCL